MSTIEAIAAKAGVSRHTVARILKGQLKETWPSKASQAIRIRRIAEELGYKPNASARALVLGKFGCVGVLMSTNMDRSRMTPELLGEVEGALARRNIHMTLARFPEDKLIDETFVPGILREWMCDGLLINYQTTIPEQLERIINKHSLPSIWLNTRRDIDCVYADDYGGGLKAARRLLDAGHRRIAYIDHSFGTEQKRGGAVQGKIDRHAGYARGIEEAGLTPLFVHDEQDVVGRGFIKNLEKMFSSPRRPTAVVSFSHYDVMFLREVLARMGLRIPGDVSVVTFDHGWRPPPEICDDSALVYSDKDLAEAAVDMLMQKIEDPSRPLVSRVVPFQYRHGDSMLVVDQGKRKA